MARLLSNNISEIRRRQLAREYTHEAVPTTGQLFSQNMPRLDAYLRKVASGGYLRENADRFVEASQAALGGDYARLAVC